MSADEERRLFERAEGGTQVAVAADLGVAAVRVARGRVGEFGVVRRCAPRDVAAGGGTLAIATDEDVLVGREEPLEPIGFGPAAAVGVTGGNVTAADPDGRLARLAGDEWIDAGTVPAPVTAIDPPFVASLEGVYRLGSGDPADVGLRAVRDVAAASVPRAATADGVYRLGNGWMVALEGNFQVVAARDGASAGTDRPVAHAATLDAFYRERAGEWEAVDLSTDGPVVDVDYADGAIAITEGGCLLLEADADWRSFELGLDGVRGLAVL